METLFRVLSEILVHSRSLSRSLSGAACVLTGTDSGPVRHEDELDENDFGEP